MIPFEVIVTSVHDRSDLLDETLRSMLEMLDQKPTRIIVHEDVRGSDSNGRELPFVAGRTEEITARISGDHCVPVQLIQTRPGTGLARAMVRLLEAASSEFVFYTQEDFQFLRPVPVARCLEIMQAHALSHVRFNKRSTIAVKGMKGPNGTIRPKEQWWTKQEVQFDGQTFCISDHVYYQANLTRRALWLEGHKAILRGVPTGDIRGEARFNHWLNTTYGNGAGSVDGDQEKRRDLCRTFIWGGVGEPKFIEHTGQVRRTQKWNDPAHDQKFGTVNGEMAK